MAAYLNHRRLDPFDLLGVAPEAAVAEIEERFLTFAERYSPWSFTGPELEPIADRARELFVAGAAAFGQLMDAEQRNVLRARRTTLLQKSASAAPSFAIKTDLLDPEVQYRKGKALLEAGKWKLALQEIEFAADCDPQNGLYRAEAAWCRFMDSPATASRKALEDLDEAVRIDPKCGVAHLYAGEIHARLGNYDEAEDWLRRANKLMAPDRRAMDALREVAAKRKKR
ncbi:MAG: tetratricopeptide repeat protein [Acidobacteriota bacterium]